jgi:hypothetical protein
MPDRRLSWHSALAAVALVLAATAASSAQAPRLEDLFPMVASYVSDFIPKFASVVAVETFEQRFRVVGVGGAVNPVSGMTSQWRLKSDVLLVQDPTTAGDLMWFRDVSEVDGKIVRHEPDRLMKLFATPGPDTAARAGAIARESIQYQVPGGSDAVTNPLLVLALMQPRYYPRLRIVVGGEERSLGTKVRVLRFEDRDGSAPVLNKVGTIRGSLWIEQASGRILKTEARIGGAPITSTTATTFAPNERLAMLVPHEMRTMWVHRDAQGGRSLGQVQGTAKYGDFRRFEVQTGSSIVEQP